jgi:hypothetical protein
MSTIAHPAAVSATYARTTTKRTSLFSRFIALCEGQQENRLLWLALALGGHGCVLTPLTILLIVAFTGMNLVLFMAALAAMAMALIVNLAALPTKITIPVLFGSILIDLVVIAIAVTTAIQ